MAFESLFKPIKLGPIEVKNRIVMTPMNVHFSDGRGFVTEQDICYLYARAKGGVGLVTSGCTVGVEAAAKAQERMFIHHLYKETHVGGFQDLTEAVHENDARFAVQLTPGFGRETRFTKDPPPAPSPILRPEATPESMPISHREMVKYGTWYKHWVSHLVPREMTKDEILSVEDEFANSARLITNTGADAIDIHGHAGYLIAQFLSPLSNHRTDEYGGSVENRARFLVEIIKKVRATVGNQLAIGLRISMDEHAPGGINIDQTKEVLQECEKAGLDYVDASDGGYLSIKYLLPEENTLHRINEAAEIKKAIKIPVVVLSVHDPYQAEMAINEGKADMIGLGRQLYCDPDWPNKVKEGRVKDIKRCQRCCWCWFWIMVEGRSRCIINPQFGRERFIPEYWPKGMAANFTSSQLKGITSKELRSKIQREMHKTYGE